MKRMARLLYLYLSLRKTHTSQCGFTQCSSSVVRAYREKNSCRIRTPILYTASWCYHMLVCYTVFISRDDFSQVSKFLTHVGFHSVRTCIIVLQSLLLCVVKF